MDRRKTIIRIGRFVLLGESWQGGRPTNADLVPYTARRRAKVFLSRASAERALKEIVGFFPTRPTRGRERLYVERLAEESRRA